MGEGTNMESPHMGLKIIGKHGREAVEQWRPILGCGINSSIYPVVRELSDEHNLGNRISLE